MKNVYLIANAHLDPVWLWRWEEGYAEALSTFRTAAELTDEYPGFVFNHNESILYEWVKEGDPELFETIRQKVKEGTWHIMGGWFLQPDCNMPSGESIVRNMLRGRKFFKEEFDQTPKTAINFDSFGHSKGLVQVLTEAGYDSYLVCRPAKNGFPFPEQDFLWKGFHGSEIRVHRSDENYNSVWGHAAEELRKFLEDKKDEPVTLCLWGVGDHGGGATREDLRDLTKEIAENQAHNIRHATPEEYFAELGDGQGRLPVVDAGLNPVADGCYTSQIRIKQKHRELENAIYSGEKMASAAEILGGKSYPEKELEEATRALLFSEFHDALPGSGSQLVEEDTIRGLDHGLEIMSQVRMKSFVPLAAGEPRIQDGTSVIMFYNPHPFDITGDFTCECGLPKQNWTTNFMYPVVTYGPASDHPGEAVPCQADMEESNFSLDWRKKVVIHATLKAASVTRFDVNWKPLEKRPEYEGIVKQQNYTFDNGVLKAVVNTQTGLIDSVCVNGKEYLSEGSFELTAVDDSNSPWGLHSRYSHLQRPFRLLPPFEGTEFSGIEDRVIPSIRVIEDGEVHTVVEALFGMHDSKAYVRYIFPKHGDTFDVEIGMHFAEKQQMVKLVLNSALPEDAEFTGQVIFGRDVLARNGQETVSQKWLALHNSEDALAVINAGSHGASLRGRKLALTLLRSAGYTASDFVMGKAYSQDRYAPRMEQGMRTFRLRIAAGGASLLNEIDNDALVYNEAPYALAFNPYGLGKKPAPFFRLDNRSIVVSAFKKAVNGDGYILRVYETTGQAQTGRLQIEALGIDTDIHVEAQQVKTYRISKACVTEELLLEGF